MDEIIYTGRDILKALAKEMVLTNNLKEIGGKRIFSFESWQVAVKFGFKLNK